MGTLQKIVGTHLFVQPKKNEPSRAPRGSENSQECQGSPRGVSRRPRDAPRETSGGPKSASEAQKGPGRTQKGPKKARHGLHKNKEILVNASHGGRNPASREAKKLPRHWIVRFTYI